MPEQIFLLQGQWFNDDEWQTICENTDRANLENRQEKLHFVDLQWHFSRIVSKEDYLREQEEIKKLKEFDKLTKDMNDLSDEQIARFRKQVGLS
jgi:hypothetical protein